MNASFNLAGLEPIMVVAVDLIALTLIVSGYLKTRDIVGFRILLLGYSLIPRWAVPVMSKALPLFELSLGAALFAPPSRRLVAGITCAFFAGTAVFVGASLLWGSIPEHCGCFGTSDGTRPSWKTVLRQTLLTVPIGMGAIYVPPLSLARDSTAAILAGGIFLLVTLVLAVTGVMRKSESFVRAASQRSRAGRAAD